MTRNEPVRWKATRPVLILDVEPGDIIIEEPRRVCLFRVHPLGEMVLLYKGDAARVARQIVRDPLQGFYDLDGSGPPGPDGGRRLQLVA